MSATTWVQAYRDPAPSEHLYKTGCAHRDAAGMIADMTRKPSADRHSASTPPAGGVSLIDALIAFHNPTRRRLFETLTLQGPAPVGVLSNRCGIAAGSASHHLAVLHRAGWVCPAPELASDSRESWWRASRHYLTWTSAEYPSGTAGSEVLNLAERENASHEFRAVMDWISRGNDLPERWQQSTASGALLMATIDQLVDFGRRLNQLVEDWSEECHTEENLHPQEERRAVRVVARVFPDTDATR